ncbi:unnamed protein product [Coregonus sp. 'balchen']|nr:unnamed protein product [Coregonus sp. 'balchen']
MQPCCERVMVRSMPDKMEQICGRTRLKLSTRSATSSQSTSTKHTATSATSSPGFRGKTLIYWTHNNFAAVIVTKLRSCH